MTAIMTPKVAPASEAYLDLVRQFPLRPIRSDAECEAAIAIALALDTRGDLGPDEEDYHEVLVELIGVYEKDEYPRPQISGPDRIRAMLEARLESVADLARGTGIDPSSLSAMLSGRRRIGANVAAKLAAYFHIDAGKFLTPPKAE
jgi:HTH-type transcriptional regulator / antitoxin HigA